MADASSSGRFGARFQGFLYGFLYATVRRTFLFVTIRAWLKNLPLFLALFMLLWRWPMAWPIVMVVLALILRLLYWKAKRDNYMRFVTESDQQPGDDAPAVVDNHKVALRATGVFSVKDWEEFMLGRPADYWRVPMGDHAVMVQYSPGRFLYQFIRLGAIEAIEAGSLFHGRQPQKALAVTFLTSWGPESDDVDFMFYAPSDEDNRSAIRRKMFLAFEDESIRASVWRNLLRDGSQTT
ncbi:MAG TPA: hypothetical protein VLE70_00635 [Anaerolineae bacterium]|jgi:hypothetical protein|nr:hypothetical protein [Anaerolineae bacterium]